jgi:hypothetical protein
MINQQYRTPEDVIMREVGEDTLLLNTQTHQYYALNPIGTKIIKLLTVNPSVDKVVHHIQMEYEASEEQIRKDVEGLIVELQKHKLLELV